MKKIQQGTGDKPSVMDVKKHQMKLLDQTDLSGLTTKEQTLVQQVLIEQVDVLSVDGRGIGDIT